MEKYNFQFCQKIVIFSKDLKSILLAKRKNERDYNGLFSFVGGKMEAQDKTILAGLKREKDEELGSEFKIKINVKYSNNVFFLKKDGSRMILPHYYAIYERGEINLLTTEYSEYKWVLISELVDFEPKIENIPESVKILQSLMLNQPTIDLIEI